MSYDVVMKPHKKYIVEDFRDLRLRIFTIGYPREGESILGVIEDGNKHLFSFVIDSYQVVEVGNLIFNETLAKVQELGISSIDTFIWTHPDADHSTGICTLLSASDKDSQAIIYLPMLNKSLPMTEEARLGMDFLFEHYNRGRKYNMQLITKGDEETNSSLKLVFTEHRSGREITGGFYFLAPCGAQVLRDACVNKGVDFNRLSIMFSLRINNFDYLFCGDLMGENVHFLDRDFLKNVQFIKIPHHGSWRTRQLAILLKEYKADGALAVTTIFQKSNLPEEKTIQLYNRFCKGVYSTSSGLHKYGCIEICFSVWDLTCDVVLWGNAKKCV